LITSEINKENEIFLDKLQKGSVYLYIPTENLAKRVIKDDLLRIEEFLNDSDLKNSNFYSSFNLNNDHISTIKVDGLHIVEDFVDSKEEEFLYNEINQQEWVESQSG
jgi:hypothetical protein